MTNARIKFSFPDPAANERDTGQLITTMRAELAAGEFPLLSSASVTWDPVSGSIDWRFDVAKPMASAASRVTPSMRFRERIDEFDLYHHALLSDAKEYAAAVSRLLGGALESARAYHYSSLWG